MNNQKPLTRKIIKAKKKKLYSFDIETYGKNNKFLIGSIYDGQNFETFKNKELMIKRLLSIKEGLIIATNLGFDFNVLFYNTKHYELFKIIMSKSKLIGITLKHNRKLLFVDTLNYAPFSVEQLGQIIGINKLIKPKCLGRKPLNNAEWNELIEYNKTDTLISYKFIELLQELLIKDFNSEIKLTISGCSLEIFRKNFVKKSIKHENNNFNKEIFEAYYGGRTEVFYRGLIKNAYMYDINSLYPAVMCNKYPVPETAHFKSNSNINYLEYEGVSKVLIEAPDNLFYPLLPYRVNNKLIFPIGEFIGSYTHIELRKALSIGYKIKRFFYTIYYSKTFYPFKKFVNKLYDLRLKYKREHNPMDLLVKLLLNSLSGKFGQKETCDIVVKSFNDLSPEEFFCNDVVVNNDFAYIYNRRECNDFFVFPIFSAYTTAYGRLLLYDYIVNHNALYCDTDSIITFDSNVFCSEGLGFMKKVYDIRKGIIVKPKMYYINDGVNDIVRLKGIPRADVNVFNKVINRSGVDYFKFVKFREGIRRRLSVNSVVIVHKDFDLNDNKRLWFNDFVFYGFDKSFPIKIYI